MKTELLTRHRLCHPTVRRIDQIRHSRLHFYSLNKSYSVRRFAKILPVIYCAYSADFQQARSAAFIRMREQMADKENKPARRLQRAG